MSSPNENPILDKLLTLQQLEAYEDFKSGLALRRTLTAAIEHVLDAAIALHDSDFGTIQLLKAESRVLEIRAQRGFDPAFLDVFRTVSIDDPTACGRALRGNTSIVIRDVNTDPAFAPYRAIAEAAGFRAVQSTPAISASGKIVGILSTHFRRPHVPTRLEMHLIRLYARCLADAVLTLAPDIGAIAALPLRPEEFA